MKRRLSAVVILLFTFSSLSSFSQHIQSTDFKKVFCPSQIDSVKTLLTSQGFTLFKEASLVMQSSDEMPVSIPLKKGSSYHFVFISEQGTEVYQVSICDQKNNKVVIKKNNSAAADGSIIECSYKPEGSQYHLFRPVIVSTDRSEKVCGYLLMFKKVS